MSKVTILWLFLLSACIASSARSQVIMGAETSYGGLGPDQRGYIVTIGAPVSKGEIEYGVLFSFGRRFTAEPRSRREDDSEWFRNNGDEVLFFIRPTFMYKSGFGVSPRLGIALQSRLRYPDTHTPEIRNAGVGASLTYFYYGADIHYRPLSWLQFSAGFAPQNGASIGAYLLWDLSFLKK